MTGAAPSPHWAGGGAGPSFPRQEAIRASRRAIVRKRLVTSPLDFLYKNFKTIKPDGGELCLIKQGGREAQYLPPDKTSFDKQQEEIDHEKGHSNPKRPFGPGRQHPERCRVGLKPCHDTIRLYQAMPAQRSGANRTGLYGNASGHSDGGKNEWEEKRRPS